MFEDQKKTMVAYNSNPAIYVEKFSKNFKLYANKDAEKFASALSGKKILDVGCGPGIELEFFREKGLDALGIDLSDSMLKICQEKGLNVRKMDMKNPILWPNQ